MANDTRKLMPVPLSELDPITDPEGFWIFGSRIDENDNFVSGKYEFTKLAEYASELQFERRIQLKLFSTNEEIFVGEPMDIYKVTTKNVSELKLNGQQIALETVGGYDDVRQAELDIKLNQYDILSIISEQLLSDPKLFIYIHAKVRKL